MPRLAHKGTYSNYRNSFVNYDAGGAIRSRMYLVSKDAYSNKADARKYNMLSTNASCKDTNSSREVAKWLKRLISDQKTRVRIPHRMVSCDLT